MTFVWEIKFKLDINGFFLGVKFKKYSIYTNFSTGKF